MHFLAYIESIPTRLTMILLGVPSLQAPELELGELTHYDQFVRYGQAELHCGRDFTSGN